MAGTTATRDWRVQVFALFISAFAICTAELIVTGLLPTVAADLVVDIPTAGLLITGYALGVAIASPVIALLTGGVERRALLLAAIAAFVLGNLLCAISTTYWMLLASRLVVACCHGVAFGVAMVIAMRVAPEGRKASAVSMVVAGVTLATIVGVPVGTAIGNSLGWHAPFWVIAGLGAVAWAIIFFLIPAAPDGEQKKSNLRAEVGAATRPLVLGYYAIIAVNLTGVLALLSYIVPLLTTVSGVPLDYIPWVLFGMGFTGFFGNLIGGRLADRSPIGTMVGILVTVIILLVVMSQVTSNTWAMLVTVWLVWLVGFGFPAPVQAMILEATKDAPNFASTLISTAFNVGIAAGAAIGGAAIAAGWGYGQLPLIWVAAATLALVGTLLVAAARRRNATAPVGV